MGVESSLLPFYIYHNMSLLFKILEKKKTRLEDKLFSIVDDYEIYCHFLNFNIELGETTFSPLRENDTCGSFGLFEPTRFIPDRPETLLFKDLGTGAGGDIFKFCRLYASHHYNVLLSSKYAIIKFIDEELQLGLFILDDKVRHKITREYIPKRDNSIYYKSRPFTRDDLAYWEKFGIKQELLIEFDITSVKYLLDEDGFIRKEFRKRELAFVYIIQDKLKLYRPLALKEFKFRNTCPGNNPEYYQGYDQIQGYDNLIITKSMKDVLCFVSLFRELEINVDVIAPHAESINLDPQFLYVIRKKYKRIIIVSDFDLAGVHFANKYAKMGFEIKFISTHRQLINGKYKVLDKDISDFHEIHGRFKTKKLIKQWKIQ